MRKLIDKANEWYENLHEPWKMILVFFTATLILFLLVELPPWNFIGGILLTLLLICRFLSPHFFDK